MKKILFPLLSLFLLFQTYKLIKGLLASNPMDFPLAYLLWISFLLTLFITGIFAFIGFAYPTNKLLPNQYYALKNPERLKRVYAWGGVHYFRILLLLTFWGSKNNRKKYFDGTKRGVQNFVYQSKQSEFGHLAALVAILVVSVVLLAYKYFALVAIITAINILGNLYPILLQRYHRLRIGRIADKLNSNEHHHG
jgi:dolichol kinase